MAWTNVVARATGYVVTATNWNEFVNNFKAIGDAWTSYTPAWTATGTAPAVNNGSITGSYISVGKLTIGKLKLTLGSTSTVGTGSYRFSLPVTAADASLYAIGSGFVDDASGSVYAVGARLITTTTCALFQSPGTIGATSPVVPANGDVYTIEFAYEAA